MARSPVLGGGSLNPFGGSGTDFSAFNIAASLGEQAYLLFRKKEIQWENGQLSDAEYLTALEGYGNALQEGSSEKLNAQQRFVETKYRIERNNLIADVENGEKEWTDLFEFDKARLNALPQDGTARDEQMGRVREVQQRIFSELEEVQREKYDDGKITSAQLEQWYRGQLDGFEVDDPELEEAVTDRLDQLGDAVTNERDAKMINDFNAGKVGYSSFMSYANGARGRYAKGTTNYDEWTERISDANDQAIEQSLTYRYGLSQRYDQLARFVKDHGTPPKGHTVTSTSKGTKGTPRVVWTGSGWKTVYEGGRAGGTTTKYVGPSKAEQQAWAEMKIQVADAKKQMKELEKQMARQPGGWVSTDDMLRYYGKIQSKYAKGSPEWYNVQERLDSLNQQKHAETVLKKKGIRISYPKVKTEAKEFGTGSAPGNLPPGAGGGSSSPAASAQGSAPKPQAKSEKASAGTKSGDRVIDIDEFMKALARVESGGRYDAVNKSSGAKGKYQIMPANWAGWAGKYLGNSKAAWTPENQEKVARGKMQDLYRWLKDWRAVAHWWLTGGSDEGMHQNPERWSSSSRRYVNKVFGNLGLSPTKVASTSYHTASHARRLGIDTSASSDVPAVTGSGAGGGAGSSRTMYSLAGPPAGGSGGGAAAPTSQPRQSSGGRIESRSAFTIPKNMDGRQYERFYQRFLDAYEAGDESFIDYSSGRPISYFIPGELEDRSELIEYLDEARIAYFAERARAYVGTASEEVAMTQYSDAIKKSGENQMLILDTHVKAGAKINARTGFTTRPTQDYSDTNTAAKALNPIAAGLRLQEQTETGLAAYASGAEKAWKRGDAEMAYALIQRGLDLAAANEATLRTYYANAAGAIKSLRSTGAKMPEMVDTDMDELFKGLDFDNNDRTASPYGKSLAKLEEITGEIEKFIDFDERTDEPIRRPGATDDDDRFQTRAGVDLYLKPDGSVEYKQTRFSGWTDPSTPQRDNDQYVTVSVKIGQSVKQVKAEWESTTIGFIEGTNIPIKGKLVTGMMDGKEFAWVENPFAPGKWIRTTPGNALSIKAPAGMAPFRNADGSSSLEFKVGGGKQGPFNFGGGSTYRLQFDEDDGTYHVFEAPGLFGSEWKDLGSASSSKDLASLFGDAGWKVDNSKFKGDDAYFFNSTGAWIGFDKKAHEATIRNTQSPRQTNGQGYAPGFRLAPGNQMPPALTKYEPARIPSDLTSGRLPPERALPRPYSDASLAEASARRAGGREEPGKPVLPPVRDDYARTQATPTLGAKKKAGAVKRTPPKNTRGAKAQGGKDDVIKPKTTVRRTTTAKKKVAPAPKLKPVAKKPVTSTYSTLGNTRNR